MKDVNCKQISAKFGNHKRSATSRGIECTLTVGQFKTMIKANNNICDYTGMHMDWFTEENAPTNLTIERIDEKGIYEVSNILLVRRDANILKSYVLETKSSYNPKGKLDIETKEMLNKICEVVYNPTKLKEVQSKYIDVQSNNITEKETIKVEDKVIEDIKTTNPEIKLAQGYAGLGKLVESVSTFELTYAQYKSKMNSKKCGLTGTKFNEGDVKSFWWVDKTLPFTKDNSVVTTMKICRALDKFMVDVDLSLTDLKHLGKVVSLK